MKHIETRNSKCIGCYKCLKICVVKSLDISGSNVGVIEDECVYCGRCIPECPDENKLFENKIDHILEYLQNPCIQTAVSLDPSFISAFGENSRKIVTALKALGFDLVEETAVGAAFVTMEYQKHIEQRKRKNIITTACPTINMLIQKYYPDLTKYMAPVMSPMAVHGKYMKDKYGEEVKVIFIGPCLSRGKEAEDYPDYIDGVMTFTQVSQLLEKNNLSFDDFDENESFAAESSFSRIYPIKGGIILDLQEKKLDDGTPDTSGLVGKYTALSVSGLNEVSGLLKEIREGKVSRVFAELSACRGGCINGPLQPDVVESWYGNRLKVRNYANNAFVDMYPVDMDFSKRFTHEDISKPQPTEEEIKAILSEIGRYTKERELNCGSCGYSSCREKAIAVYQKKADLYMCMAYIQEISRTLSNVILSKTPYYIIAVDKNMKIKEFNFAAQKLFGVTRNQAMNRPLDDFMETSLFEQVFETKKDILDKKVEYPELDMVTSQIIVYSAQENVAIGIINNITEEEKKRKQLYQMKLDSVNMTKKVIDKQMMVAQQIASLLGETTAETKVTLNKLKGLIENEGV